MRLSAAAALAAVSPFLWPSAILLFPLYAERHISRSIEARRPTSALLAESYTLYGLLRNLSLARAKKEQHVTQPSFLARIGEAFAYDELPSAARAKIVDRLQKNGFSMSAETSEILERQVETHQ